MDSGHRVYAVAFRLSHGVPENTPIVTFEKRQKSVAAYLLGVRVFVHLTAPGPQRAGHRDPSGQSWPGESRPAPVRPARKPGDQRRASPDHWPRTPGEYTA
ncbi:hypothetical protein [Paenarthrobacter sp. NPDC089316]|uniref:hypothetical protein n=1 Tax=unclassified Paenarthrobacter TaxID=2634190 RepID=UPI00342E7458